MRPCREGDFSDDAATIWPLSALWPSKIERVGHRGGFHNAPVTYAVSMPLLDLLPFTWIIEDSA